MHRRYRDEAVLIDSTHRITDGYHLTTAVRRRRGKLRQHTAGAGLADLHEVVERGQVLREREVHVEFGVRVVLREAADLEGVCAIPEPVAQELIGLGRLRARAPPSWPSPRAVIRPPRHSSASW